MTIIQEESTEDPRSVYEAPPALPQVDSSLELTAPPSVNITSQHRSDVLSSKHGSTSRFNQAVTPSFVRKASEATENMGIKSRASLTHCPSKSEVPTTSYGQEPQIEAQEVAVSEAGTEPVVINNDSEVKQSFLKTTTMQDTSYFQTVLNDAHALNHEDVSLIMTTNQKSVMGVP